MISNLTKKPDIIIVDNNVPFRQGLILLLTIDNVASVIGKASNGTEFIELLSELKPDMVLMDINMPQMNGIEATQKALEMMPDLKVIVFTMYGDEQHYFKMIELGVKGFILKSSGINELERVIQDVMKDKSYFSDELIKKFIINFDLRNPDKPLENAGLDDMETEIMQHICHGFTNDEMAKKLSMGLETVTSYQSKVLQKLVAQFTSTIAPENSSNLLSLMS